jgi:hypothetical protein
MNIFRAYMKGDTHLHCLINASKIYFNEKLIKRIDVCIFISNNVRLPKKYKGHKQVLFLSTDFVWEVG